jgi:D-alanyl-lipoteichoic acid acyltransferase DltB (MBOAT superfamily)
MVFIATFSLKFLLFAFTFTVINYFFGIWLCKYRETPQRVKIFWTVVLSDIAALAFFKYINFLIENIDYLVGFFSPSIDIPYLNILIPLGISYYTFQALGYLIRINRRAENAENNFIYFANYMMFFPKFLAGPVERSNLFLPQARAGVNFDADPVSAGLRLFLWGMFKKVVIGDNLSGPVYLLYNNLENYTGISLMVVFLLQAVHLYADFSGYTDMALGIARVFGLKLTPNFNRPFFATSVGEFWRRWHISLSSWCNDFIFAPFIVKYRRYGQKAAIAGIFITFFVIGIWHGPNWTFVVLGVLQGIAISYEFITKRKRLLIASKLNPSMVKFVSRMLIYLFFSFTLVFFNAKNIADAWYFISHLFVNVEFKFSGNRLIFDTPGFLVAMFAFAIVFLSEALQEKGTDMKSKFLKQPRWVRWFGYYTLMALIFYYSGAGNAFVYLKF